LNTCLSCHHHYFSPSKWDVRVSFKASMTKYKKPDWKDGEKELKGGTRWERRKDARKA